MVSNLKKVSAFVPGKIIISGEHSVVYGMPALACAINKGITIEVANYSDGYVKSLEQMLEDTFFAHILDIFKENFCKIEEKLYFKITSTLPQKSGLGSSASFAGAVFKALLAYYEIDISQQKLINLVWQAENFIHGSSSGLDPAVVIMGGLIKFQKKIDLADYRSGKKDLLDIKFQKAEFKIEQIDKNFDFSKHFELFFTGEAVESTGEMVEMVYQRLKSGIVDKEILWQMGELTKKIIEDFPDVGKLITKNHDFLVELGVVSKKAQNFLHKFIKERRSVKIVGAGGIKAGSGYAIIKRIPTIKSIIN